MRTSGENRISNFLLWQCAYSEFVPVECYCKYSSNYLSVISVLLSEFPRHSMHISLSSFLSYQYHQSHQMNSLYFLLWEYLPHTNEMRCSFLIPLQLALSLCVPRWPTYAFGNQLKATQFGFTLGLSYHSTNLFPPCISLWFYCSRA